MADQESGKTGKEKRTVAGIELLVRQAEGVRFYGDPLTDPRLRIRTALVSGSFPGVASVVVETRVLFAYPEQDIPNPTVASLNRFASTLFAHVVGNGIQASDGGSAFHGQDGKVIGNRQYDEHRSTKLWQESEKLRADVQKALRDKDPGVFLEGNRVVLLNCLEVWYFPSRAETEAAYTKLVGELRSRRPAGQ